MTPIKSIRLKCLDCCCGSVQEVRLCPSHNCPLWPYRMGKRPITPGEGDNTEKRDVACGFFEENEKQEEANSP